MGAQTALNILTGFGYLEDWMPIATDADGNLLLMAVGPSTPRGHPCALALTTPAVAR